MAIKASDTPEISKKWWTSEKPNEIKGEDLAKALASAEKALADAEGNDPKAIDVALAALKTLGSAVDKTIKKECDPKKYKHHKDVVTVLEKYEDVIEGEVGELEESKVALSEKGANDGEEDGDEKGVLKPEYLARMIKKLRGGEELNFGFGLDKADPGNSRLVLCNKRDPERLKKIIKMTGEFGSRLMTFGKATGDGKVLQFSISEEAKEPAQILKTTKAFLKGNKELKFKKLRILVNGQSFEEDMPDGDEAAPQVAGNLNDSALETRLRKVVAAAQIWKQTRATVSDQIAQLQAKLDAFDDPDVKSVRDRLGSMLERYPNLDFSAFSSVRDRSAFEAAMEKTNGGLAQWKTVVAQDPALKAIDKNPFLTNLNITSAFGNALDRISSELGVA